MMWNRQAILLLLISAACSKAPGPNKFSDPSLVKIFDLKDKRLTDSLLILLRSGNPVYRREAAMAFGSIQDTLASMALGTALLEDPDNEVRRNAAFALGQLVAGNGMARHEAAGALLAAATRAGPTQQRLGAIARQGEAS